MRPSLRPYQVAAVNALRARVRSGVRRQLLVSPTGSGKTVMLADIVHSAIALGTRVLFVAHRKELIDQTSAKLDAIDVPHGIIMADHPRRDPFAMVQVASIQSLMRREKPPAELLIIDEAHHARADSYQAIIDHYAPAPVLGATATPWRTDGKGLKELFDDVVVAARVRDLIEQGHLVPFDGFGFDSPDLRGVHTVAGDYNELELAERVNTAKLVGGIVEKWCERVRGRRTIAFAVNVEHSRSLVAMFQGAGVPAEHLDGTTPKEEREAILARLRTGETQVISNCAVLTEGWDEPSAEVCILARPTKSVGLYLQCVGRVLRPNPATGKTTAFIHDHAGALLEHGLPDEDRDYTLDADVKKKQDGGTGQGTRQCPDCARICTTLDYTCPRCHFVFEEPRVSDDEGGEPDIEYVQGEQLTMAEIRALREASNSERAAEYKRLLGVAERRGMKKGWARWEYRRTYGDWPPFSDEYLKQVAAAQRPPIPLDRLRLLTGAQR